MKNLINKLIPIDFEYNRSSEPRLNLVCCAYQEQGEPMNDWLHFNDYNKTILKSIILELREEGHIFLAFNVEAEARSFIALGIDPTKCKWIDLQTEYKMLLNHNHTYMYGKQLIDGREVVTTPPVNKWKATEEEIKNNYSAKPQKNLAACLYKLLGIKVDTAHKDVMRNLIISDPDQFSDKEKDDIMRYCQSDVVHLVPAIEKVLEIYGEIIDTDDRKTLLKDMLWRGETGARVAIMTTHGYPINLPKVKRFIENVPHILKDLCEDINSQFPEEERFFRWNNARGSYSMYQKPLKEWIKNSEYADRWMLTDTKAYSLGIDAWSKHFSYRHNYPEGDVAAQIMRFLKTRQNLNGFLPKSKNAKNKNTFMDSVGSDGRVRAYLGPYNSQSARFQPKATGFIPLKAAWMRSLIEPKPGRAICAVDYKSEEFLLAGLMSGDMNMLKAYRSGDVYLYFAKLAGAVPWDGKKKDYPNIRNQFKSTTLGISYSMGPVSLANKLTADTGKKHTEDDARALINKFKQAYPVYTKWIDDVIFTYQHGKEGRSQYWIFEDNWIMFQDNDNPKSISNVPIQQMGSALLRKAIQLCQEKGLHIMYPLHDALYMEYDSNDMKPIEVMKQCMREAFAYYFEGDMKQKAYDLIGLDVNIWSQDYEDGYIDDIKVQKLYIDERSVSEYEKFKKYME